MYKALVASSLPFTSYSGVTYSHYVLFLSMTSTTINRLRSCSVLFGLSAAPRYYSIQYIKQFLNLISTLHSLTKLSIYSSMSASTSVTTRIYCECESCRKSSDGYQIIASKTFANHNMYRSSLETVYPKGLHGKTGKYYALVSNLWDINAFCQLPIVITFRQYLKAPALNRPLTLMSIWTMNIVRAITAQKITTVLTSICKSCDR